MTAETTEPTRVSARDRLLAAANELFYSEGIHTVGIDRIIEHAGVAKASLYNSFGSKDELVEAYLVSRHANTTDRITRALQRYRTPRTRLLGVFDAQGELFADPDFRGCAFVNATAEAHDPRADRAASRVPPVGARPVHRTCRASRGTGARSPRSPASPAL